MDFEVKKEGIILYEKNMSLDDILDCGQAFRWEAVPSDYFRTYKGFFKNIPLTISETEHDSGKFILHGVSEEDFLNIWFDYFDFNRDYGKIKNELAQDKIMNEAIKYGEGIRILNQD